MTRFEVRETETGFQVWDTKRGKFPAWSQPTTRDQAQRKATEMNSMDTQHDAGVAAYLRASDTTA